MGRRRQGTCYTTLDSTPLRFSYRTLFCGEVCGVIFRDFESDQDKRNKTARLVNMMDSNGILWENMKPTKKDTFDTMVTLRGRDE